MAAVPDQNGKNTHLECTLIKIEPEGRLVTSVCLEGKDAKRIYSAVRMRTPRTHDLLPDQDARSGQRTQAEQAQATRR